ncbi:hypothetical protein IMZ08_18695 [Bacillus luteolus]|uniref:Uncharacterized protein n=1 Tax=Litchfieldia luteola TaxID=682179 RepID=A0ABR9QNH9_9BACI|nr:hypothetical protein [Cytobacillus luteolus]MBE4910069.1 hypothetical protein [Cytobacillus luteolus]MBP1942368.1 hypothetical protein [Cytobacillus luteolus]
MISRILRFSKGHLIALIFICLILTLWAHGEITLNAREHWRYYPHVFYVGLIYIPIGILLGYLGCFKNYTINGKWKFKLRYFLFMCIPSIYLLFYSYLHYIPYLKLPEFLAIAIIASRPYPIFGLIFGYGLITSFYKVKSEIQTLDKK